MSSSASIPITMLSVGLYGEEVWVCLLYTSIKGEEMTRLVNSLPDRTGKKAGEFAVVQEPAPEGNICLKSDVDVYKRQTAH